MPALNATQVARLYLDEYKTRPYRQDAHAFLFARALVAEADEYFPHDAYTGLRYIGGRDGYFILKCEIRPENARHTRELVGCIEGILSLRCRETVCAFAWPILPNTWHGEAEGVVAGPPSEASTSNSVLGDDDG